jgi:glycine oxidase
MAFQVHDVVVIGGGIIGGLTARELASRGLRVCLLEANEFGAEASSAAAGMLAPGGEYYRPTATAQLAVKSLHLWPAIVETLTAETGISIDYRKSGAIELAMNEREAEILNQKAVQQAVLSIKSESLKRSEVEWLVPKVAGLPVENARYYLDDSVVEPRSLMRALRASLLHHHVYLQERSQVRYIQTDEVVHVSTDGQVHIGRSAVLAAGAWSSQVQLPYGQIGGAQQVAHPVKGHLISYAVPPGVLMPILRHRDTYLVQRRSGDLVCGSTTEFKGYDRSVDESVVLDIANRASRLLPLLRNLHPNKAWSGLRPATPNEEPVIGRYAGTNLWMAYGHYRNGVLLAPGTAHTIAHDLITALERI